VPSGAAAQDQPVYRSTTRLVQVSVIVQDRKGRPVTGLTRDAFRLLEDGREQAIDVFSVETLADPAKRAGAAPAAAPPAPNTFSNLADEGPASLTVILLDRLNTRWEHQRMALDQVKKHLAGVRPGDQVALYALDRGVRVLHDFTTDTASVLRALGRHQARMSGELAGNDDAEALGLYETGDAEMDAWLQETSQKIAEFFTEQRTVLSFDALEAIGRHLSSVPGRKSLIWVSDAFPVPPRDTAVFSEGMRRATRALNTADVAVYPVDTRGLVGAFASRPGARRQVFTSLSTVWPSVETMQIAAAETGGRAFYNTNAIDRSIQRAVDDSRVVYVLGYYPAGASWDDTYRRIEVKVNRRDVEVRHRRGYFAQASTLPDAAARERALRDAARSPVQASGVGVAARIERSAQGEPGAIDVTVRVDANTVRLERRGDRWSGIVDVLIVQSLADGTMVAGPSFTFTLDLTAAQRARALREGLAATRRLVLRDELLQLRVLARDVPGGAVGSVFVPASRLSFALGR
jgi:VWFA-related protein